MDIQTAFGAAFFVLWAGYFIFGMARHAREARADSKQRFAAARQEQEEARAMAEESARLEARLKELQQA